ncbi:RHS repeat-associated core domain-containing protein [Avrilella dinanensis]|uniref:RHS repeat-associated core domain-containing protein n=1 Tax=Avrilella dinanensis TaxID=2008672 RepID=UPI00240A473E|nr:RHS repeat-associated core domain-containing protein [Avrilella dinanensis]
MNYADVNGDGEVTPGEIIEENNYYPFGLKHQGYNELAGDKHKYKFLNKEYQPELGYNTIATDYRHYDAALGRFNNMDALSELAPSQTPYRYGFNNPVYWTDPTGLFESPEAAEFFAMNELGLEKDQFSIRADGFGDYILTAEGGEFNGQEFYNSTLLHEIEELVIQANGNSNGGGTRSSSDSEIDWAQVNQDINAFGVANGVKTGLIDMAAEAGELSKGTQNYLKAFRGVGYLAAGINVGYAGYQLYENPTAGNATRLAVQGLAIGAAFIPVVGWAISLGIGAADMIWGDQLYEWIDNQ